MEAGDRKVRRNSWYYSPDAAKRVCVECKKVIYVTPDWVYRRNNGNGKRTYYCSWTCYRKKERVQEEKYGKGKYKCQYCGEVKDLSEMSTRKTCWICADKRYNKMQRMKRKKQAERERNGEKSQ